MVAPTDPLFASQWHLAMLGDIQTIWNEYTGTGVNVGVYDDGIDYAHEDLAANYDASLHVVDNLGNPIDPTPIAPADGHGTAVAGIIGAANNGVGGVGVAFGVTLTGVNIDFDNTGVYGSLNGSIAGFLDVVGQAAGRFDIISNSWGAFPGFSLIDSLLGGELDQLLAEAYGTILANGRGGLGTIVVKSAGNNNQDVNGEGTDASRFTITVAATESTGFAASYSEFGAAILVTAPAAAVTTDLSGDIPTPFLAFDVGDYSSPTFVDFDDDGDLDLVSGAEDGRLRAYSNNGANVFTELTGAANPFNAVDVGLYSFVSFGDINGDGDLDMVTGADDGLLRTYANNGSGAFTELAGVANPFNGVSVGTGSAPAFVDFNQDGNIDLVAGAANGLLRAFTGNGTGGFAEVTGAANPFNGIDIGAYSSPAFGDIDADGDIDMVVGAEDGLLRTYANNGSGVFSLLSGAANPFNGMDVGDYSAPAFIDYDSDGDLDLVSGNSVGTMSVIRNDGSGSFTQIVQRGYDPGNYTTGFNGTSASTPVVSGVVALMLDANEGLGWRDVQNILAASARLTGSAFNDATPESVEDGVWYANAADTWNGGGNHVHTNYGYGMVNAYNAVRMAEVWTLFKAAQTSANEEKVTSGLNDFADTLLPNANTGSFSTTFTITGDLSIEHVALRLNFSSSYVGDLRVVLTSAEGTEVVVKQEKANLTDNKGSVNWVFGIDSLRGELSAGTWTMTVTDMFAAGAQTVRDATIDIFGSANSANDVYHFTDEYLTMRGFDASRGTISDTDGGIDWLNFAAVAGSMALNLAAGQVVQVMGVAWATLATAFENAVTGDGNDTLTGNTLGNDLHGMRGNDSIVGGLGNDTMFGGAGSDTYVVDASGDRVYETKSAAGLIDTGGIDTVQSSVGFSLDAYAGVRFVERLSLTGTANINGTGNALANVLTGNAGNNLLNGGLGSDMLLGRAGNDTYVVDVAGDRVYETTTTSGVIDAGGTDTVRSAVAFSLDAYAGVRFVERLTLTGIGNINGTGNALANILTGNAGNNLLNGGLGNDSLIGGAGNDTYVVDTTGDRVYETTTTTSGIDAGGTDTVQSALAFNLDAYASVRFVERLTLTGTGNINGAGNALANVLTGNAGNNLLNGGLGNDSLIGGAGNDTYIVESPGDRVYETITIASIIDAGGTDKVQSAVNFNLDAYAGVRFVEQLTLTGTGNINGTGNALANILTGNSGNNVLNGGLGNDILSGGTGADRFVFVGDFGNDTVSGFDGIQVGEIIDISVISVIVDFADLVANHLAQGAAGAVITAGLNTITLTGVLASSLLADDFLF